MKLIDAKFGMAVHVGGKECVYANAKDYSCELKYIESIKMTVVEVKLIREDVIAWTSFANVVYCRPVDEPKELTVEPTVTKKGHGISKAAAPVPSAST